MTERFKLGYVCGDYGLIDNDEWIDLHSMSENSEKNVQICINKMNELAEENEQLKSKLKDWHQRTFKAHEYFNLLENVIDEVCNDEISNQIWKEYEKREKLIE